MHQAKVNNGMVVHTVSEISRSLVQQAKTNVFVLAIGIK